MQGPLGRETFACVLISEEEGHVTEIRSTLDQDLYTILKGTATFIGQYADIDVIVMRCSETPFQLMENRNRLPPPFENERVVGPVLLVRMDERADPKDFTLKEYLDYVTRCSDPVRPSVFLGGM
jgi:hypothetical protein